MHQQTSALVRKGYALPNAGDVRTPGERTCYWVLAQPPNGEFSVLSGLQTLRRTLHHQLFEQPDRVAEVSFRSFPISGLTARVAKRDTLSLQSLFRVEKHLWKTNRPAAAHI